MTGDPFWSSVVALYHFEDGNGSTTAVDTSLSDHTASAHGGGQCTTAQAKFGAGSLLPPMLTASGSSDFQFGSGMWTVEAWGYSTAIDSGMLMIVPATSWDILDASGILYFQYTTIGSNFGNTANNYTPTLNTWVSYAADYDGTTIRLYVNGAVFASSTGPGTFYASGGSFVMGDDGQTYTSTWQGYIDEVRITKGVARYAGAYTPAIAAFPDGPPEVAITGVSALGQAANITGTSSTTISEVAGLGQVGAAIGDVTLDRVTVTGASSAGQVGAVTADTPVMLTGLHASGQAESVFIAIADLLLSAAGTSHIGSASALVVEAASVAGSVGTSQVGEMLTQHTLPGVLAYGIAHYLFFPPEANVFVMVVD